MRGVVEAGGEKTPGYPMYAQHGHELMGCKSPVGKPPLFMKTMMTLTTSLTQGRYREVRSEGSGRQMREPTNRNLIRGRSAGASGHKIAKPCGLCTTVNEAVVRGQFMFLSGEICLSSGQALATGAGLRARRKRLESPPAPTVRVAARGVGLRPDVKTAESPPNPTAALAARHGRPCP